LTIGLEDAETVLKVVEKYYPSEQILPKTQFLIRELLESRGSGEKTPGTFTHIEPEP